MAKPAYGNVSDYVEPAPVAERSRKKSELRLKLEEMPLGKAVIVGDVRSPLGVLHLAYAVSNSAAHKPKFSVCKLGDDRMQIARVA